VSFFALETLLGLAFHPMPPRQNPAPSQPAVALARRTGSLIHD
jgi:hypothetical protein